MSLNPKQWGEKELSHQLATPLTNCLFSLEEYLDQQKSPRQVSTDYQLILKAKKELEKVFHLLRHREKQNLKKINFLLNQTLANLVQSYHRPYELICNLQISPEKIFFYGCEKTLVEIITHLLNNAIEAYAPACTKRKISIAVIEARKGINIIIGDNGEGISWWQKFLLKFKYVSFKKFKSGLGLSRACNLLEKEFNGQLIISSQKEKGTIVIVYLPW